MKALSIIFFSIAILLIVNIVNCISLSRGRPENPTKLEKGVTCKSNKDCDPNLYCRSKDRKCVK